MELYLFISVSDLRYWMLVSYGRNYNIKWYQIQNDYIS